MIPLLINQSNISQDFSLQLSKCLADSDLVVIGLTGIGPIRKISVLAQCKFLYCIDRFVHIKSNKSKLINNVYYIYVLECFFFYILITVITLPLAGTLIGQ
jgi:hypothetical protein